MYVSLNSGHHRASQGIEQAILQVSPEARLSSINALHYTHPLLEPLIRKSYFSLLRHWPKAWDYIYDHPTVVRRTLPLTHLVYRLDSSKFKSLLESFRPGVVVCTQAFPCGMVADYKRRTRLELPLVAVLTDYQAHSYWIHPDVDYYVVATETARERLRAKGIAQEKILVYGIPVDPRFCLHGNREQRLQKLGLSGEIPTLLLMGGSCGFGPMEDLITEIDHSELKVQLLVVCGKNEKLFDRLSKRATVLRKTTRIFGFIDTVDELMEVSTCLITKPGGLTIAEALAKGLPMILWNPIGGQETANTEFLVRDGIAQKAEGVKDTLSLLHELLNHPERLREMRKAAERQGRPASALELARHLISL